MISIEFSFDKLNNGIGFFGCFKKIFAGIMVFLLFISAQITKCSGADRTLFPVLCRPDFSGRPLLNLHFYHISQV